MASMHLLACQAASQMNVFLQRHAFEQMKRGVSTTCILRDDEDVDANRALAYYSMSAGHLIPDSMPRVVSPRMTIPVFILLRLAVDKQFQRKGYGSKLSLHILRQAVDLSNQIGMQAVVVEPLNEHVRAFYEKCGLIRLPGDPARMYIRVRYIDSWLKRLL